MENKTSLDKQMIEQIALALHKAEEEMPQGQSWNLGSDAACNMLAEKVWENIWDTMH
jgi:hypothetical protein